MIRLIKHRSTRFIEHKAHVEGEGKLKENRKTPRQRVNMKMVLKGI
jgi:hypothetical protein